MGQKVHPYGFRLGIIREPRGRWFATGRRYTDWLVEDLKLRRELRQTYRNAAISDVIVDRTPDSVTVTVVTAKPGVIIGRGGRDVEALRERLEKRFGRRTRVNVEEARDPDLNAQLVATSIASQIERRVSHRWAMRQALERAMRLGAKGCRIKVSGRLGGVEIARSESIGPVGRVPLSTLRADIDYGLDVAHTTYGPIGVKVWIYRGDVLPARRVRYEEEAEAELAAEIAEAQRQLHGDEAVAPAAAPAPEGPTTPAAAETPRIPEPAASVAPHPQPVVFQAGADESLVADLMEEEPLAAAIEAAEEPEEGLPATGAQAGGEEAPETPWEDDEDADA